MKRFDKKYKAPILLVTGMILFMSFLLYLGFGSKDLRRSTEKSNKKISYVLVNQDTGADFNGKHYNLGEDFTHLINQDNQHQWQTASLSVAEAGYKQGSYDAEIILPQDFSQCLLSLEEINPEQANISYKVQSGENEVTNQATQQKILEILNSFNKKIVQMYFSSVLSNLATAQQNVSVMVDDQADKQTKFVDTIQAPLKELPSSYTSIVDESDLLKEENQSWEKQQNDFSKATQTLLKETAESIKKQSDDLNTYKKLQETISQTNVADAQNGVNNQQEDDLTEYKQYYEALNTSVLDQLALFDTQTPYGLETGALGMLKLNGQIFYTTQTSRINEIKEEISSLNQQVEQLSDLQKSIAKKYFASENKTPDTVTDEDVKTAILRLMAKDQGNQSKLLPLYFDNIDQSLSTLSVTDLQNMLTALHQDQIISEGKFQEYEAALEIAKKYTADEGLSMSGQQSFSYITMQNDSPKTTQSFTQAGTFQLDLSKENTFELRTQSSGTGGQLSIQSTNELKQEIVQQITQQLSTLGYTATPIVEVGTQTITISCSDIKSTSSSAQTATNPSDTETSTTTDSNQGSQASTSSDNNKQFTARPTVPSATDSLLKKVKLGITIPDITLNWQFSEAEKQQQFNQMSYEWVNSTNASVQNTGTLSSFVDYGKKNAALSTDFSSLTQQLDSLNQAVQQIILIFSDPTEKDLSIAHFNQKWQQHSSQTLKEQAAEGSIYMSYDNITTDEKKELISSSLVQLYRKQGEELYNTVSKQKADLQKTISGGQSSEDTTATPSLMDTLDKMIAPDFVNKEADKLDAWYQTAQKAIEESYNQWKENPAIQLKLEQYSEGNTKTDEKNQTIYFDTAIGTQLYDQFHSMATSSVEQATTTGEQSADIQSLDKDFDQLSSGTKDVKNDSQVILDEVNQFVEKNNGSVESNQNFEEKFSKVLTNTHSGGADNPAVFNFLSNPVKSSGDSGTVTESSVIPYFMTVISMVLLISGSYHLRALDTKRKQTISERLLKPSRVWMNTPVSIRLVLVSFMISFALGALTNNFVRPDSSMGWISYTTLVMISGLLVFTALWRSHAKLTIYLIGGLVASYLLMSPVIGMSIVQQSMIGWLFKLSPFQNVENGYSALLAGQSIGWKTLVFLLSLTGIGVLINLLVKHTSKEERAYEEK